MCAFKHQENEFSQLLVFDKCGKGKFCSPQNMCSPKLKLRQIGQSCKYNEDCISKLCKNEECVGLSKGDRCGDDLVGACGVALFCS